MELEDAAVSRLTAARRYGAFGRFRRGEVARLTGDVTAWEVDGPSCEAAEASQALVTATHWLQDLPDYRGALQAWFRALRIGGFLVVIVPHAFLYERRLALPARWHGHQRRLYTPGALLAEVEEALAPNSYRVRHLGDDDHGYDYGDTTDAEPGGGSDIVLVLERIALPAWPLATAGKIKAEAPDYAFEPARTRIEVTTRRKRRRILILKLDHLGDFIMATGALERARALFGEAHITLVVGSWNVDMARALGVADEVVAFDVFPRNSTEEQVDVAGKHALFQAAVTGEYDLAIDMRTDTDTRFLLRSVRATLRAGIGTRAQFPYLDIFLPLNDTRNEWEAAREETSSHHAFASQGSASRQAHRIISSAAIAERDCAIVWGPYHRLRPGRYKFDPFLEIDTGGKGLLMLDIALDTERVATAFVDGTDGPDAMRLDFQVTKPDTQYEFRVWTVEDTPSLDFSFFGGRLTRAGAASVLHQSEYQSLLVELIAQRLDRQGMLGEAEA